MRQRAAILLFSLVLASCGEPAPPPPPPPPPWTTVPIIEPSEDIAFQDSLRSARSDVSDHSEDFRRVLVQTRTLVEANRINQAADTYRFALAQFPQWAAGQFNLALLDAQEKRYRLAIIEMKRYLYLEPNAPDARASQDQIYTWQALLAAQ